MLEISDVVIFFLMVVLVARSAYVSKLKAHSSSVTHTSKIRWYLQQRVKRKELWQLAPEAIAGALIFFTII